MKKMLGKRFMFLVALLVGLCVPTMAQKDFSGAALNDYTVYYLRNAATGLYLKSGAEWGEHAAEGIAAHPIMFELNSDGTYAISSVNGYLVSSGDANCSMIGTKTQSCWTIDTDAATNRS